MSTKRELDIAESNARQDAFYRQNPRSIPGYGASTPQGVDEQAEAAWREKRRIERGLPS